MTRFLSTLGLCRRAGKLIYGFDPVCEEIKSPKSKVCGVALAKDISEKTLKEITFTCEKYGTALFKSDAGMDEIKSVLGKRTGIIAILDEGLYKSLTMLK
ncbi:MAG: ribosomal L7Ae/L30e/S12e/Gadd45 family protein [Ruminiclostridium sp.]|nr:ribosomal L7Ae/L30e/S12e/Gadd45 family protein [Ruminiclostridium sp.]